MRNLMKWRKELKILKNIVMFIKMKFLQKINVFQSKKRIDFMLQKNVSIDDFLIKMETCLKTKTF